MAVQQPRPVFARADLVVLVSRNGRGDLHDGVRTRLDRIDGVDGVEGFDVRGLRPGLNDLRVEVEATLSVRPTVGAGAEGDGATPTAAVERTLTDGFGVEDAAVERVESDGER